MKRFAYYITCCSLVALFSCTHDDIDEVFTPVGDGKITIQSTLDDMAITRATVDDTNPERTITHIDVFAIDESGNIDYYERDSTGNNNGAAVDGLGRLTLSVSRRAKDTDDNYIFEQGANYKFILVANAVASRKDMAKVTTLSALEMLVQDDSFETSFVGGGNGTEGDTTEGDGTDNGTGGVTEGTTGGATGGTPTMSRQTLLHLSGTEQGKNLDNKETPQTFLMDAVATDSDENEKWVVNPASGTVPTLSLSAEFKRAASKIIVNITQGKDVEFRTQLDSQSAQYDFYKLPASTFVLPNESKLVNIQLINTAPMQPNKDTFIWKHKDASAENPRNENTIQVIGYAYSHSWSDVDLTNETSLILNIPMMWNMDDSDDHSKEAKAPKSWYKVPLSQGKKFERNMCYIVNIEINAVGAATRSTAIELRDIEYKTLDWVGVNINVGDDVNRPAYLELNTDLVEIYNANFDDTSLSFSSSSAITSVTLKDVYRQNADGTFTSATDSYYAYYINKFGVKTQLKDDIRNTISATAEENVLNGGISILSPIVPTAAAAGGEETHYNTIRYLEFEVENEQRMKATFRVMQYPVIYITNVMGSYSYRDDFINSDGEVVTYKLWQNDDKSRNNYTRCSYNNGWNYNTGNNSRSLFCSKYVVSTSTSGNNQGKSRIDYYYWNYSNNSVSTGHEEVWSKNVTDNARMYHVRVTATSGTYIVGRPRFIDENGNPTSNVENGYTEDSAENTKLVSPSFMLASQLGATQSPGTDDDDMPKAADHCRQYVEVAADGTEYHDWRLPTAAEIDIIIKLQNNSQAMDEVLSGRSYWSASGIKNTGLGAENETGRIRCVRDAY